MNIQLSPAQSRLAALALLLVVVVTLVAALAWPTWLLNKRYDTAMEDSVDRVGRYRRIVAMRPAIEEAIAAVSKREARKQYYWKGSTPALAAAEMQGTVTKIIEANNARVFSSQTLPVQNEPKATPGDPTKVSISIQMTASIVPLQLILHSIETNQPYLFVDQLSVRSNQGRTYKPIPGLQPEFSIQLTVRGYYLPEAPRS